MKRYLPWLLSALSGVLAFLGYIGFDHFYLNWFFLLPLLWAIRETSSKRAFFLGWTAGTVGHAGGFYWFIHMLSVFAGMNLVFSAVGLLLFAAFNGLSFALFAWTLRRTGTDRMQHIWWTAPVIWTGIENIYPFIFPNFIGASQYPLLYITQIVDITGILSLSYILIWCNAVLYMLMRSAINRNRLRPAPILIFCLALIITCIYGRMRIAGIDAQVEAAPKLTTVLIQTGLGETARHRDPGNFLSAHRKMTQTAEQAHSSNKPDLIVWPETVVNTPISRSLKGLPPRLFGTVATPLLFGAITADTKGKCGGKFISALLIDSKGAIKAIYDKQILVPFGEYIPFADRLPALYRLLPYTSCFQPGNRPSAVPFGPYRLSVNICYEDLFPGLIRKNMTADANRTSDLPNAIFNLTNDSWYGDTVEPKQHLILASFRAIEHRRALVRATNTGISAIIDPAGRITRRTGQWTAEILKGHVPMMTGRTFFSLTGNWFGWSATLLALSLLYLFRKVHSGTHKR